MVKGDLVTDTTSFIRVVALATLVHVLKCSVKSHYRTLKRTVKGAPLKLLRQPFW